MLAHKVSKFLGKVLWRASDCLDLTVKDSHVVSLLPTPITMANKYVEACESSLERGLIKTLNEFADAVNKLAIEVRKEGDLLLTLGVSDEDVMKASNLAQLALSCVNLGRGKDLKGDATRSSFSERKSNVLTGMTLAKEAQRLLNGAKKHNAKEINKAVAQHQQILNNISRLNLSKASK